MQTMIAAAKCPLRARLCRPLALQRRPAGRSLHSAASQTETALHEHPARPTLAQEVNTLCNIARPHTVPLPPGALPMRPIERGACGAAFLRFRPASWSLGRAGQTLARIMRPKVESELTSAKAKHSGWPDTGPYTRPRTVYGRP